MQKKSFLLVAAAWMACTLIRSSVAFTCLRQGRSLQTSGSRVLGYFSASNVIQHPRLFPNKSIRTMAAAAIGDVSNKKSSLLKGKRIVSVSDCLKVHGEPGVVFVDGSWFLKGRNGREEFEKGPRVSGAQFFDIDEIAATGDLNPKGLPHMMPPPTLFASAMDAMDITNDDHLIVYGSEGCMFVHRAWFTLRAMGHDKDLVHFIDGSLKDWEENGGELDRKPTKALSASDLDLSKQPAYRATNAQNVVDIDEVKRIIKQGDKSGSILVDVRAPDRFNGLVEEPRPGMRLGHMPGAKNVFFLDLLDADNVVKFKSTEDMAKIIANSGLDINTDSRIVIHCGSGATACALVAALDICGRNPSKTYIYDGSWSEWGAEADTPIVKDGTKIN